MAVFLVEMDLIDRKIVGLLAADARRSLADIGAAVELSPSAVNERIRRLVATGAIRRFTVDADHRALGLDVLAFVWVALASEANEEEFRSFMAAHPMVSECHHVTGGWSYLVKVRMPSLGDIEPLIAELKRHRFLARSETVIVLSTVVENSFTAVEPQ